MNRNLKQLRSYFNDFQQSLGKRSLGLLFFSDFFTNFLDWHLKIWQKEMHYLHKNTEIWNEYFQTFGLLNSIFDSIHSRVLSENTMDATYFYDFFGKHIEKNKTTMVQAKEGDKRVYVEQILPQFCRLFFEKIGNSPNHFNIWESYYPKDWVITTKNIANEGNQIQRIILVEFLRWAENKIPNPKEEFELSLDELSEHLFPETDPALWSEVLTFVSVIYPTKIEDRLDYVIEKQKTFGFAGRMRSFESIGTDFDKDKFELDFKNYRDVMDVKEKEDTIKLTFELTKVINTFHYLFTKDNLKSFIEQAESLKPKFENDPLKEDRRKRLLEIFEGVLHLMKE